MLISFSVQNFKSIRDKIRIDMTPSSSIKDEPFNLISTGNDETPYLHKVTSIYGLNGSGKSNLLQAANSMRALVLLSGKNTVGDKIHHIEPFRLDASSRQHPTTLAAEFIINEIRYFYEFSVTSERVTYETLHAFPKGAKQVWFERTYSEISDTYEWKYGPHFRGERIKVKDKILKNTLYLSKAVMDNDQQLVIISEFFRKNFFVTLNNSKGLYTEQHFKTEEGRERVITFLKDADLGIDDITVVKRETPDNDFFFPGRAMYETKVVHIIPGTNEKVSFDLEKGESTGTIKLFKIAGPIINALNNGGVLFVDELEHDLHPKLQFYLIELFNRLDYNPHGAQLIFTTHAPLIFEQIEMRRDQIWFTSKTAEKNTILYSLIDVPKFVKGGKPVRKGQDLLKGFLDGKFYEPPKLFQPQLSLFEAKSDE